MDSIKSIVFVCTGNTCRSPMAQAIALREAERRRLNIELISAGTGARPGDRATDEAVTVCSEIGIDLSYHTAQSIIDVPDSDETLYIVMSRQHASWMRYVLNIPGERVMILGEGVPDPYGGSVAVYRVTRNSLIEEIGALFDRIEPDLPKLADGEALKTAGDVEYELRKVTGDDANEISLLERHAFTDPWSQALLADEIDNEDAIFIVAAGKGDHSKEIYGYALALIAADVSQLPKLCVGDRFRRRGLAEAMLEEIGAQSVARGCTELTLEVRVSNTPAISLYEKMGFESMGVRPGFYSEPKEDALIMTKQISPAENSAAQADGESSAAPAEEEPEAAEAAVEPSAADVPASESTAPVEEAADMPIPQEAGAPVEPAAENSDDDDMIIIFDDDE